MTYFIILFEGRTGSSYLLQSLRSHPNIFIKSEILECIRRSLSYLDRKNISDIQNGWIRELYEKKYCRNIKTVGFKTKLTDVLDRNSFAGYLKEKEVRVIHMKRKNIIKQTISLLNGERLFNKTGKWNLEKKEDKQSSFEVDIRRFDKLLKEREKIEKELDDFVQRLGLQALVVFYEEFFKFEEKETEKIKNFLKIKDIDIKGNLLKNTDDNLKNVITNYKELFLYYKDTKYEKYFL